MKSHFVKINGSAQGKIVTVAFLFNLILMVPLIFFLHRSIVQETANNFLESARVQSSRMTRSLAQEVTERRLMELIHGWEQIGVIKFGKIIATSDANQNGRIESETGKANIGFFDANDQVYTLSVPFVASSANVPLTLILGFDKGPATLTIQEIFHHDLFLMLTFFVASILVAYLLGGVITKTLNNLRDGARLAASGSVVTRLSIKPIFSEISDLVDVFEKIREQFSLRAKQLQSIAYHDPLTGLLNRIIFNHFLDAAIENARDTGKIVAVIFLDLDRFKRINDTLGHDHGDQLLKTIAARIQRCVSPSHHSATIPLNPVNAVARLGGDEFTVMLSDLPEINAAGKMANEILNSLRKPITLGDCELHISASIGISLFPFDGVNIESIMKNADTAMYHAKKNGKNCFYYFSDSMVFPEKGALQLEGELHRAIAEHHFVLHYQPQFNVKSGNILGVEALVRWKHETLGLLSPADFIPLAEESTLIIELGNWVLTEVCSQLRRWREKGITGMKISANVSPRQLQQPNFLEFVESLVSEYGIKPGTLVIEVTESIIMEDGDHAILLLKRLRLMGIEISIDDFGTGYSSLSYLSRLPVDELKIDGSLIRGLSASTQNSKIVQSIITLANALQLRVVAECVETESQRQFLELIGCSDIQGFVVSKALNIEALEHLMDNVSPYCSFVH
jgi:diguanylate cyclase (GGDEF)-like protein